MQKNKISKLGTGKHENIVLSLEERLKGYTQVRKEVALGDSCVDLLAYRNTPHSSYLLFFEIKSNHTAKNVRKAVKQLSTEASHFKNVKIFKFGVYGVGDSYFVKRYR